MSGLLSLVVLAGSGVGTADDPIPAIVAAVDGERLIADVRTLARFGTRHSLSDTASSERGIGAARRWLVAELERVSGATGGRLAVSEQRFATEVDGREVELVNVLAFLPGRGAGPLGRTYLVSGHYDSRASGEMDAASDAPGADDDASGTAVVLELARVLGGVELEANLVFACFDGEELGLLGSTHFAEDAASRGLAVDGMITNDIVGGVEGGNGVVDERTVRCFSGAEGLHSPSRELARSLADAAARHVPDADVRLVLRLDRLGRGGDHMPFHERGFPALRLTEANEHYARQHEDVREEDGKRYGDLPEFVSAAYLARVCRVNAACLAELALAPPPPEPPRLRGALSYDTRLSWPAVPGAAGYEVVWRDTTAATWQHVQAVGPETTVEETRRGPREAVRATVSGVTADGCFFGVRSVSASGHRSRVVVPERP